MATWKDIEQIVGMKRPTPKALASGSGSAASYEINWHKVKDYLGTYGGTTKRTLEDAKGAVLMAMDEGWPEITIKVKQQNAPLQASGADDARKTK